jgi:hypothetical protein
LTSIKSLSPGPLKTPRPAASIPLRDGRPRAHHLQGGEYSDYAASCRTQPGQPACDILQDVPRLDLFAQLPARPLPRAAVLVSIAAGAIVATGLTALIVIFVVTALRS